MNNILSRIQILLLPLLFTFSLSAQDSTVQYNWEVSSTKTGEGTYDLHFRTSGVEGWQLYSPNQVMDLETTELSFSDPSISIEGKWREDGGAKDTPSEIFEGSKIKIFEGETTWIISIRFANKDSVPAKLQGQMTYSFGRELEFYTAPFEFTVEMEGGIESQARIKITAIDIKNPLVKCGDEGTSDQSIFTIFLLGMLGGLIALLTPCVFPMIPVTVTFFTKRSTSRKAGIANAVLYGFFIFMIYALITIPFHIASKTISPEIFNNISSNAVMNLVFFAIFVVFALSFFGLFEIGLPSGLANRTGSKSGIGNIAGIFFMAGTLAIVSFSCTGPILGTLLANVAVEGAWPLTAGAAGFGLALGLPFALFAMFPHWLISLPKSGGWMTEVKVVLGFIELALAVKFLSNADLVKQWGLLKREVFIALWVIIGSCIVIYLLV